MSYSAESQRIQSLKVSQTGIFHSAGRSVK
jgi:hypothetical protein